MDGANDRSSADAARGAKAELEPLRAAHNWLAEGESVALATVVSTWGSSPVPVGGQMAIARDGRFQGSVSGGCIENDIIAEAGTVLAGGRPATLQFGVSNETAWQVGLPCGGQIRIFLEGLHDEGGRAFLDRVLQASDSRQPLLVRTRLEDGHREIFEGRGDLPEDLAQRLAERRSGLAEAPEGEVFLHALVPPARIVVVGANHIAQVLCELAKLTGYDVAVVDPRTAYTSDTRFPGVRVFEEWPQDVLPRLGLDPYTAVVALTHSANIDDEALKAALRAPCAYVGALGSKRNHAKRTERLLGAGFTPADLARIRAPIGLDIGARTPQEIALSIMAEIVLAVRGPRRS